MLNFTMEQCSARDFSSINKKAHVKWYIDAAFTHVNIQDLIILGKNMPKQSIVSSQIDNNVETDFSQNENDTSSWGATCHHNKSNISENNTKQKD